MQQIRYLGNIEPGAYSVYYNDDNKISSVELAQGGVHNFIVAQRSNSSEYEFYDFLLSPENSIHMLWIFPQYFIITSGEIMFSVTALEFTYSQVK